MSVKACIFSYISSIIVANLMVTQFGPSVAIINAFLFIGLDLTLRDSLHDAWKGKGLVWRMGLLILTGSLLSYLLNQNAGMVAIASFTAFGVASVGDALTYHLLRKMGYLQRANGSNLVGATLDSLIFPTIAFGGFMPLVTLGQLTAKVAGGFVWSLILSKINRSR